MKNKQLLEKLAQLGYPLLETDKSFDVNKTLAEVVKSNNFRYLESFPVLLVNAHKTGSFNFKKVETYLTDRSDRKRLRKLLVMSLALYRAMNFIFTFAEQLRKDLSTEELEWFKNSWPRMRQGENFNLDNKEFNTSRLKTVFNNYMQEQALEARKTHANQEELSLEFALSQLFSPKQKELFFKKLKGEVLTKTEREYFSRTVKKKAAALANSELHHLAQRVFQN